MSSFKTALHQFAAAFEHATRSDGARFYRIKSDAHAWLQGSDVMRAIHSAIDDRLPDDWVYEHAMRVARDLDDRDLDSADDARDVMNEVCDSLVDVYNSARYAWLASNLGNAAIVDQACDGMGMTDSDITARIGVGQFAMLEMIANAVIEACDDRAHCTELRRDAWNEIVDGLKVEPTTGDE